MVSGSDSDLSDVPDPGPSTKLPMHFSSKDSSEGIPYDEDESALSDDNEDGNMGSDDGDFEMESPLPRVSAQDTRSPSEDSRRPMKRKLGIEDDEDIMNNPELYGIRRSVCIQATR